MSAGGDAGLLLDAKVMRPPVRDAAVERPRVIRLIRERLEAADVLLVTATAGAGKTTSVVHALADHEGPVAWLHIDHGDAAAGRFLVYLEHALVLALPGQAPLVDAALKRGITHPDCAALLAESLDGSSLVIVVEDADRIESAPKAMETLATFLKFLPGGVRTILVSRRQLDLGLARAEVDGRVLGIGERELAFSVDEARAALTALSRDDVDAHAAVEATGGWVTGVLFESWRSSEHVHGGGGEVDPLSSYLSTEIMSSLSPELQHFLVTTAVLDLVTPEGAARLGFDDAALLLGWLRRACLPVVFESPHAMRCHARFREYLLERLNEVEASTRMEVSLRYGRLLAEQGRWEDAVDELLAGGDVALAEETAEHVIVAVARRLDFDVVARWLSAFRPWRVNASPALKAADLLVAVDLEEFGRAARAADQLVELADWEFLGEAGLFGAMAWSYFVAGRVQDSVGVLGNAPDDLNTRAIRFCIGVELIDDATHYDDRPHNPHTELDGLLARVDLAHGRFDRVLGYEGGPQRAIRLAQAGALTGLGRLEDAWERLPDSALDWTGIRMRAELLAESARPAEAWSALIEGRTLLGRSESPLYRIFSLLTETMLALRFRHDVDLARAALQAVVAEPTALDRIRVLEQLALWNGLIALFDEDSAQAVSELRRAVDLMTKWDRWLFLPTAAVYLAEAEWRAGNADESDRAADLALEAATATGSVHELSRALDEFPSVLSRRIDLEADRDGPWHDLGRTLLLRAEAPTRIVANPSVTAVELDRPAVIVGGRRHEPKLLRTVELLTYLAIDGPVVNRAALTGALFESKNDKAASAYLRMAVNDARQITGVHDCITYDATQVAWTNGRLSSTFLEVSAAYRRVRSVKGAQRLRLAMELLGQVATNEVLPGARSPWVNEHRMRWADLVRDLRQTAAEAAYETAQYGDAHRLVREVLGEDPYRERAWRLAMHVAAAVGDTDRVIATYRDCESALRELPAKPSAATRALFDALVG
jgi:DNA-binding SARP family transcriptional activator